MANLFDLIALAGKLRYGVSTAEKERLAAQRLLPGAPEDDTADQDAANRYAAGFLFAQQYPQLAQYVQPVVDRIKVSDLPVIGGASPELQSYASQGVARSLLELANRGKKSPR